MQLKAVYNKGVTKRHKKELVIMSELIRTLFAENPEIEEAIEEFCAQSPEYLKVKQEFYETAQQIAEIAGYHLYDQFERRFALYTACSNDLYYLFGLGLRQEIISALQSKVS
jgi:hypothetical protein